MKMAFGFRDLLLLLIRYPKNKLKDIRRKRNARRFPSINASLTAINTEGNRLNLFFCSGTDQLKNWHVSLDGKNFYPKHDVSFGQKLVTNYHKDFCALTDAFIDIPLDAVKNKKLRLFNGQEPVSFRWTSQVSYNALEMREKGLFCRIDRGVLYIQTRARFFWSAMFSRFYGVRDKLVLLFLALNPFHPITIMAENMGAADNAFQLFTYALDKGEQVYFVVSDKVRDSQRDSRIKKRMLVHNSYRHHLAMMFSGRWISSFSLRAELFPTRQGLKDIHYCFIPAEWIFVPHGMAVGDKLTGLFHRYNWDNPGRTFVSTKAERDAFSNIFDFKNVAAFGAPRMDKWYGAELDENEIFIYFTWRLSLSKANDSSCVAFTSTTYYKTIVYAVTSVRRAFPAKHIEFAFHHEVVKQGYDEAIKQALDGLSIKFIYLNDAKGTEEFNGCFRSAKYLVTDISSVAFDFAYKEGAIPVYYQPEGFLNGHYEVEPVFYDIQLGVITRNVEELCTALSINTPTVEMAERRKTFYQYLDGNNTARVYEAIFKDRKKTSHTVVAKELPPRRLAIYLFYDADGIVDDYIPYCLTQLQTVCSQIWVVVNGNLTDEGRRKLESNCDRLVVRENIGFDSWGYKQAIETIGFDSLKNDFDELILTNYTYYGPIYPFIDMFAAMSERECDFWSHSRYSGHGNLLMDTGVRVDDHLQSYFLVFRKDILRSGTFRKYWDTLLLPTRYSDAVAYHELRCLKYFEQKGFISDSFIPSQKYKKCPANPPVFCAYSQLTEDKSPILKRKIFYVKDSEFEFPQKEPHTPYEIIKFIRGNTDYDIGLILENLERTVLIDERKKDSANEVTNKDMKSKRMGMERKNATYSESDFIRLFERTSNAEED
jgi:CDP-glycerol glycerophosphotransferase (TagB/SpsB family)